MFEIFLHVLINHFRDVFFLPVAVGGRADTEREINTTLSRQRQSIVKVA